MVTLANAAARLKSTTSRRSRLPALWLMTDAQRLADPLPTVRRLPRGSGVIIRHTDADARRRIGAAVMKICRQRGLTCLIAGDWRCAAALRAHGLHLGERLGSVGACAPAQLWRRTKGCILTISAHSDRALRTHARLRPDALVLAPVFATASHPAAQTLGASRFARLVRNVRQPVIALGGIRPQNVLRLAHTGAAGIAAIGALLTGS